MRNLEFDEPTHTYKVDGVVKPSVSKKISRVLKNDAPIPEYALEAVKKGVAFHKIIRIDLTTGIDHTSIDPKLKGWWESYCLLKEDAKLVPEFVEYPLYDHKTDTCMTIDYIGKAYSKNVMWDWKTGGLYKSYRAQLGGYHSGIYNVLERNIPSIACVQLFKDGKKGKVKEYDPIECIRDWDSVNRIYNILIEKEKK